MNLRRESNRVPASKRAIEKDTITLYVGDIVLPSRTCSCNFNYDCVRTDKLISKGNIIINLSNFKDRIKFITDEIKLKRFTIDINQEDDKIIRLRNCFAGVIELNGRKLIVHFECLDVTVEGITIVK